MGVITPVCLHPKQVAGQHPQNYTCNGVRSDRIAAVRAQRATCRRRRAAAICPCSTPQLRRKEPVGSLGRGFRNACPRRSRCEKDVPAVSMETVSDVSLERTTRPDAQYLAGPRPDSSRDELEETLRHGDLEGPIVWQSDRNAALPGFGTGCANER